MKCRLKRLKNDTYFCKHITDNLNHWTCKEESKTFNTVSEARAMIKLFKIKNAKIEKKI